MLVIEQMPLGHHESAHYPIANAVILDTDKFMRNPFLLETKVLVASSYRHDEEDAARPSVSKTAVVTRSHLRVPQNGFMLRAETNAPVSLLLLRSEFGQEARNPVGF